MIERDGVIVAVLPFQGEPVVADGLVEQNDDGPSGFGALPSGRATISGRSGSILWTAGRRDWSPRLVDAGQSWTTVRTDEFWITSGLADEAPEEWELPDGRRQPTGYRDAPLA
jgi:hypothetical protein